MLLPATTITLDAALRDVAAGSAKARVAAAQALGDVDGATERARAQAALQTALDDDEAAVRAEACASLGALGDRAAVPGLVRRLDDGHAAVRQAAAIALGTLRDPAAFAPLVTALREGPPDLRFQAATSLAEIDPAAAIEPLLAALGDRDAQVRGAVALSLGAIGDPRAVEPIAALVGSGDDALRFDVGYALAQLGDGRGRPALRAALSDRERGWDAVIALEQLGAAEDATDLAACLAARAVEPEVSARAAAAVLRLPSSSTAQAAARTALTRALGHRRDHVRGIVVEELARIAPDRAGWAVPLLVDLRASRRGRDLIDAIDDALAHLRAGAGA
jgi:HEAT repeat protein